MLGSLDAEIDQETFAFFCECDKWNHTVCEFLSLVSVILHTLRFIHVVPLSVVMFLFIVE